MAERPALLLDPCAVVNLFASRNMGGILAATESVVAIADFVYRESQYVFRGGDGDDARDREPVELQPHVDRGVITVFSLTGDAELLTFIDLTQELDDGEAATGALALHRRAAVITDDRKAIRVLTGLGVACRSSLDLVRVWSERMSISDDELRTLLVDIRRRGSFEPAKSNPLRSWWEAVLTRG